MIVEHVDAVAFGPLRDAHMSLAPGMTVVFGPNEAGKSSWHQAIYAALCGIRRGKGKTALEDRRWAERHKPWSGDEWRVSAVIKLSDGRRIELTQDLAAKIDCRATDLALGRDVSSEIIFDGAPDASCWLGLNREAFRATASVRQAEILSVTSSANALQESLQRAAATAEQHSTASQALANIEAYRATYVGSEQAPTKPLLVSRRALEDATAALKNAERDHRAYLDLQEALARAREQADLANVSIRRLRARRRAAEAGALSSRLDEAARLSVEFPHGQPQTAADAALADRATTALERWRGRPAADLPAGPDAASIRAAIGRLPAFPDGDLEPSADIQTAHATWESLRNQPASSNSRVGEVTGALDLWDTSPAPTVVEGATVAELEAELAALPPSPTGDTAVHDDVGDAWSAWRTARDIRSRYAESPGDGAQKFPIPSAEIGEYARRVEGVASYRAAFSWPVAGAASTVAAAITAGGLIAAGASLLVGATVGIILGTVVLIALAARTNRPVAARDESLRQELRARGLPVDVSALRRLAEQAAIDEHIASELIARDVRREQMDRELGDAETRLLAVLRDRGEPSAAVEADAETVYGKYVAACNKRASLAHEAARRPDLDARIRDRRLLEAQSSAAMQKHRLAADAVTRLARELLGQDVDGELAATRLRAWIDGQRAQAERGRLDVARAAEELANALQRYGERCDPSPTSLSTAYRRYIDGCTERALTAQSAGQRSGFEAQLETRLLAERQYEEAVAQRASASIELIAAAEAVLAESHGDEDDAAALAAWMENRRAQLEVREAQLGRWGRLAAVLSGQSLEELRAAAETATAQAIAAAAGLEPWDTDDPLPDNVDEVENRLEQEASDAHAALAASRARLDEQMDRMMSAADATDAVERARAEVERLENLGRILELTRTFLVASAENAHRTIAPQLNETLNRWLAAITRGRYEEAFVDPKDLAVTVRLPDGALRVATALSHGTAEQIYLLLRVALAQHLVRKGEITPLLLDDVTVQFDTERTRAVLDVLHEVSRQQQIVLFSQEQDVLDWAREALREPNDLLTTIEVLTRK